MSNSAAAFTDDAFLDGRLLLRQPVKGHRAGHDAMLLAAATAVRPGHRVVEFGAGVGAAGLAVAVLTPGIDLVLVEIDDGLVTLARDNAARNGISARAVMLDIASRAEAFELAGLPPDSADAVLMNPPFNDATRHRGSPDAARESAHVARTATLDSWVHAARRVLKPGGVLTMIWRADGLADVLMALQRGFGGVGIQPVHGRAERPAIRILVRAAKGGRGPLEVHASLDLSKGVGCSPLRGEHGLPLCWRQTTPLTAAGFPNGSPEPR